MGNIRKDSESITLLNERYNTPHTSLLLFHFEPEFRESIYSRLKNSKIQHHAIDNQDLYIFDQFFTQDEAKVLTDYSRNASFSRNSYADQNSKEKGEEPAKSMNNREKWEFFAKPKAPFLEIYSLLSFFSNQLHADISTQPWDICDESICASAVATNRVEKVSKESMETGKHEDINPKEGIPFSIPILYENANTSFPGTFENGAPGKPWLVTLMVYVAEDNFLPFEYGMGTIFYKIDGSFGAKAEAVSMRFVLFEGDISHSIEASSIPSNEHTWRISYVFKLIINPKLAAQSMKAAFYELIKTL